MREHISKLSKGFFEYDAPRVETSVSVIELELEEEVTYHGSIELFCSNSLEIKGIAYSTNDKLKVINPQFLGSHNEIKYEINTRYAQTGDIIEGKINIVSNGNELAIPYIIRVKAAGSITCDDFCELVENDYDKALALFSKEDFRKNLIDYDKHLSIYDGLIKGHNKKVALEEFLVAINRKNKIAISISRNEKTYKDLTESVGNSITLTKDNPGYVKLKIESDGDFIEIEKKLVDSEDFIGNNYEIFYVINPNKLHSGNNYGFIRIHSNNQTLIYYITVENKKTINSSKINYKKSKIALFKSFIEYSLDKISLDNWGKRSLRDIENLDTPYALLVKAYIFLRLGKDNEGEKLLDKISSGINAEDIIHSSLYYYLRAIQTNDDNYKEEISSRIKQYYNRGNDEFILLWILLEIDNDLREDTVLKLNKIKEQFSKSCRSPLIYLQALEIYNNNPEHLNELNDFEIQVLLFGIKNSSIKEKLAKQISDISMYQKDFNHLIFKILEQLYNFYEDKGVLESICSMLIRGNKSDNIYFKWFELGTLNNLKITKLYDYFIYSIDTANKEPFPKNILMYFIYNANSLQDKQAYLYYNIVINKRYNESIYRSYYKHIEKYACSQIKKGNVNEFLSVIYKEIFNEEMLDEEILSNLPRIACSHKLECNNTNISRVIVSYDELSIQHEYILKNGVTYIDVFTNNFYILFEDIDGDRYYKSVDYNITKLFGENKFLEICLAQNPNNGIFITNNIGSVLKNTMNHVKTLNLLLSLSENKVYRDKYFKKLMKTVVDYYYRNYEDVLDEYLLRFDKENMNNEIRSTIIELMILRGLYDDAWKMFSHFGHLNVDARRVLKFCAELIQEDNSNEDELLISLSWYAFTHNMYNDSTLNYLGSYYNGTTSEMLELWKTLIDFECENRDIEKRLLSQMLFTKSYSDESVQVYESYFIKGAMEEIRHAYLNFVSYEYFVHGRNTNRRFFIFLEDELLNNFFINDICKLAYLKHHRDTMVLKDGQIKLCKKILMDLNDRDIRLNFFKQYEKWINLPFDIMDKAIIQYMSNPKDKLFIHFRVESEEKEEESYVVEEMRSIYPGVFVKEVILFYDEKVSYYITGGTQEKKAIRKAADIYLSDHELYLGDSSYGMLNNIILSIDMNDEGTLKDLALQYSKNRYITDNIFEII